MVQFAGLDSDWPHKGSPDRFLNLGRIPVGAVGVVAGRFGYAFRFPTRDKAVLLSTHRFCQYFSKLTLNWLDTRRLVHLTAVYNDAGNVIETHEHAGDFKQP